MVLRGGAFGGGVHEAGAALKTERPCHGRTQSRQDVCSLEERPHHHSESDRR